MDGAAGSKVATAPKVEEGGEVKQADLTDAELLVSGMPVGITEEDLRDLFGIHGILLEVSIAVGPGGFYGLVRYEDQDGALAAIEHMHGHPVLDARLKVRRRKPNEAPWLTPPILPLQQASPSQAPSAGPRLLRVGDMRAGCELLIFDIPDSWGEEDVGRLCAPHGPLVRAQVIKDAGSSQTYAMVGFSDRVSAMAAMVSLRGQLVGQGNLRVEVKLKDFEQQVQKQLQANGPSGMSLLTPSAGSAAPDEPQEQDTMMVPKKFLRILIGKDGQTIKYLSRESGARIEVSRVNDDSETDRAVYIIGSATAISKARRLIQIALMSAREIRPGDPNAEVIRVSSSVCRMIIGHGGETITSIRKDSGARIETLKDDTDPEFRLIVISGPDECVEYARDTVMEIVDRAEGDESGGSARITEKFDVPEENVGKVIGRGGETINKISKDSGATISSKSAQKGKARTLRITGSPEEVEDAKNMINDLIRSGGRERTGCKDNENSKVLYLPARTIGAFIGKGGENIHSVSNATGCHISIPQIAGETGGDRRVELSGSLQAIEKATLAIQEFMDQMFSEKIYIDEVDLSYRKDFWPDYEDGLHHDVEIFIAGLPSNCQEKQLWEHLCRLGASDVREILLIRRDGKSKGKAYVLFGRHESAVLVRSKLNNARSSLIACDGNVPENGEQQLTVWFSESERCIKGKYGAYGVDMVGLLLGTKGANVQQLREETGLRRVVMTGAQMRSFGQIDEDPRLHLIVRYEEGEEDRAAKAFEAWGDQIQQIHLQLSQKRDTAVRRQQEQRGEAMEEQEEDDNGDILKKKAPVLEGGGESDAESIKAEAEVKADTVGGLTVMLRDIDTEQERRHEILSGHYEEFGEHQERPVYKKSCGGVVASANHQDAPEVYIYYLDPDAGDDVVTGSWWFGSAISGEEVWAKCDSDASSPPEQGWELTNACDDGAELFVLSASKGAGGESSGAHEKKRKKRKSKKEKRKDRASGREPLQAGNMPTRPHHPDWGSAYQYPPGYMGHRLPAPPLPVPPPWTVVPHGGTVYYVNQETGERSWYPPPMGPWTVPGPPLEHRTAPSSAVVWGVSASGAWERDSHRSRSNRSRTPRRA